MFMLTVTFSCDRFNYNRITLFFLTRFRANIFILRMTDICAKLTA